MKVLILLLALLGATLAEAVAEISAPATVAAGDTLVITWSGEKPEGGRFQIVTEQGERLKGSAFGYFHKPGAPIKLSAPLVPGNYGVVLAQAGELKALQSFVVTPVTASVKVPPQVEMNAAFQVQFTGPGYSSDLIAIAEVGANQRSAAYTYPGQSKNGQVTLKAPVKPGQYDVIYKMRTQVLARTPLRVAGTRATLMAPASVQAGGDLEVVWTGPDNNGDFISLVAPGLSKRGGVYNYTKLSTAGRLRIRVPETLGEYDLIYMTGGVVLARRSVEIVAVNATIDNPAEAVVGQAFHIGWTGPGNHNDAIVMMPMDQEPRRPFAAIAYVVADEPKAKMIAPKQPGAYQLHYLSREGKALAQSPIAISPAPTKPGFLKVAGTLEKRFGEDSAVEIILDASGSMLKRQGERRRIDIAKDTIIGLLGDVIPAGANLALRVFGHKQADSCRTDLEIPLSILDPSEVSAKVSSIRAMNLAKTPIADSLAKVAADLAGVAGERIVILVTDGEETCDGDPALAIRSLRAGGQDIRVNIVGYSIDDAALQETFASWAAAGGGQYLDAPDAERLASALRQALAIPFEVFAKGELVASGISGAPSIALAAGGYEIRFRQAGQTQTKVVQIEPEALQEISLP